MISVSAVAPLVSTLWTVNNACVARFMNPFIFTGPSVSTKWRRGRRTDESKNRNEAPRDPRPQSPADFVTIDLSRVFMCVSVRVFLLRLLSDINCVSFSLSVPMDLGQGELLGAVFCTPHLFSSSFNAEHWQLRVATTCPAQQQNMCVCNEVVQQPSK